MCFFLILATRLKQNDVGRLRGPLKPVAACWIELADYLEMTDVVPTIRGAPENKNDTDRLRDLLIRWLKGHPTLETLCKAVKELTIEEVDLDDVVSNLKARF